MNEAPLFELALVRPSWQARANCHPDVIPPVWQEHVKNPVELFYPTAPPSGAWRRAIETICGACPVQAECREWAVQHERIGFWGGVGQSVIRGERGRRKVTPVTPEIDPRTRQTIGTFIPPSHGTTARYAMHMRGREADFDPCEACLEAHSAANKGRNALRYKDIIDRMSPEELAAYRQANNQRRADLATRRRRGE